MAPRTKEQEEASLARMPQWIRQKIETLERSVEFWQSEANIGPEESNTTANVYSDSGGKPLGINTVVRFSVTENDHIEVRVVREGVVDVRAHSTKGSGLIAISPRSSNAVEIKVVG